MSDLLDKKIGDGELSVSVQNMDLDAKFEIPIAQGALILKGEAILDPAKAIGLLIAQAPDGLFKDLLKAAQSALASLEKPAQA